MSLISTFRAGKRLQKLVDRITDDTPSAIVSLKDLRERVIQRLSAEVRRGALDDMVIAAARARGTITTYIEKG